MEMKEAMAGTLESGDILIQISPADAPGLQIDLDSTVEFQFGKQIKKVITETLDLGRLSGPLLDRVDLQLWLKSVDPGKLVRGSVSETSDQVRARVTAAAVRATGVDVWK